jgi:hypothetical protein
VATLGCGGRLVSTAIYETTRALRTLLSSQLRKRVPTAVVTLLPPGDALPETPGVNLYLYRVQETPFTRNDRWRGDRSTPASAVRALGLQLSYLLTPLGAKPEEQGVVGDDAHTMLGEAMLTLHENPIVNRTHLASFDADSVLPDFLRDSFEELKVVLVPTSIDELARIWSTINQPYRMSVAYEVSVVLLRPTSPPPADGAIVTSTDVSVVIPETPRLAELDPSTGPIARVSAGAVVATQLVIGGVGLTGRAVRTSVTVDGELVTVTGPADPRDTRLQIVLPERPRAGPRLAVNVAIDGRAGAPLAYVVSPWLATLTPIRTALESNATDTGLVLRGSGFTATPHAVRFEGPTGVTEQTAFADGGSDSEATVEIPAGLGNGHYAVRLLPSADGTVTNPRFLQVIPRIDTPVALTTITTELGSQAHRLTIAGARLEGADVRILVDGAAHLAGPNADATQIVLSLGTLLREGSHTVAVSVDGHSSHTVELEV